MMKHGLLYGFILYLLAIGLAVVTAATDRFELFFPMIALIILVFIIWTKETRT